MIRNKGVQFQNDNQKINSSYGAKITVTYDKSNKILKQAPLTIIT